MLYISDLVHTFFFSNQPLLFHLNINAGTDEPTSTTDDVSILSMCNSVHGFFRSMSSSPPKYTTVIIVNYVCYYLQNEYYFQVMKSLFH